MFGQKSLRQFIALAEELNFRRAAQRLHMSQPPLTQAIRRLEESIGVRLFERSKTYVRLTAAGELLLPEARRALAHTEQMIETARRAQAGVAGTLRVSFVPSASMLLLPRIAQAFRERYPAVGLELNGATTTQQLEWIRNGVTDVGIVVPPLASAADLFTEILCEAEILAAVPTTHRLASRTRIRLAELADDRFVLMPMAQGPAFLESILAACRRSGFFPNVVQEASPLQTVVALVACGAGVSLLPESMRALDQPGVRYLRLSDRFRPRFGLALAWSRRDERPLVTNFVDLACLVARVLEAKR